MEVLNVDYSDSEDDDDGFVSPYTISKNNGALYSNSATESGHDYSPNHNVEPQRYARNSNNSAKINDADLLNNAWDFHRKVINKEQELDSVVLEDIRIAIIQGNLNFVKQTLQRAGGLGVDTILRNGWNSLMFAAYHCRTAILQHLLDQGANPNFNKDLLTPLMVACTSKPESEEDLVACVKLLVNSGARVNDFERHHTTPLMFAAREGHCQLVSYLISAQADLDAQDNNGWTALCWATSRGHGRVVRILLEAGADALILASSGERAVDIAYLQKHKEIMDILERYPSDKQSCNLDQLNNCRNPRKDWLIPRSKSNTCTKYEELEMFLNGLGFSSLIPLFNEHMITFRDLLLATEQDLIQIGITQHGIRLKILEMVQTAHKCKWGNASLMDIKKLKNFTCMDATAMIRNINKHLCYIQSSIMFAHRQIDADPQHLEMGKDVNNVKLLLKEAELGQKNCKLLYDELQKLCQVLSKFKDNPKYLPADTVTPATEQPARRSRGLFQPLLLTTLLGGLLLLWKVKPPTTDWLEQMPKLNTLPSFFFFHS